MTPDVQVSPAAFSFYVHYEVCYLSPFVECI